MKRLAALLCVAVLAGTSSAADPVVVQVKDKAAVRTTVATIGDVALVTGGDPATRSAVSQLDLVELKGRDRTPTISRRAIEYRIRLAGIDPTTVVVTGAERTAVEQARRALTSDEVVAAVRNELTQALPATLKDATVSLAVPLAVKLPEVGYDEAVTIAARPHSRTVAAGRVQMDTTIAASGRTLLAFAVHFDVRSSQPTVVQAAAPAIQPAVPPPAAPTANEAVIRPQQRVTMLVRIGALTVSAVGESQHYGRLGQVILVQNVDSKKLITARVTGPGTVEVELGG